MHTLFNYTVLYYDFLSAHYFHKNNKTVLVGNLALSRKKPYLQTTLYNLKAYLRT